VTLGLKRVEWCVETPLHERTILRSWSPQPPNGIENESLGANLDVRLQCHGCVEAVQEHPCSSGYFELNGKSNRIARPALSALSRRRLEPNGMENESLGATLALFRPYH